MLSLADWRVGRQVLDAWLPGRKDRRPLLRKLFLITFILCIMLLVALLAPGNSGKVGLSVQPAS